VEGCYKDGLTSRSAQRVIRRYGEEAGLPHLTPHILRHTFAKNLVNQGVGLEKVAVLLGHASLNTTRIYVTPGQRDLENAVEKLND
ncbi:MAG: tyrosine-type recombinase/integrase, partial [Chloroflexota bacterium]